MNADEAPVPGSGSAASCVQTNAGCNRQEATPGDAWCSLSPIPGARADESRAGFFMKKPSSTRVEEGGLGAAAGRRKSRSVRGHRALEVRVPRLGDLAHGSVGC